MKSHKSQISSLKSQEPGDLASQHVFRDFLHRTYRTHRTYKSAVSAVAVLACVIALTGCKATETLAAGITTKNVSGNGTVVDSRIGIDPDTKIPALKTVFISGDFATVKSGTNQISYREESSASVWNASSVTKKRFLAITLVKTGDVPAAIKAVAEVFKEAERELNANTQTNTDGH